MRAACRPPVWADQACAEPGDKLRGRHSWEGAARRVANLPHRLRQLLVEGLHPATDKRFHNKIVGRYYSEPQGIARWASCSTSPPGLQYMEYFMPVTHSTHIITVSGCSFIDTRVTVVQREATEREASGEGVAVRLAATLDTNGAEGRWRA